MGDRADNNCVITANFVESDIQCIVSVGTDPSGGSVRLQPEQPEGGYPVNQTVSVMAVAETGYVFGRWTGDLDGIENPRDLLVSEDMSFAAIFNPIVTIYYSPADGGSVLLEPQSSNGYPVGTEVTLTATANNGYRFVSWEGDLSGSGRSVTTTVYAPMVITAAFAAEAPSLWWLWLILGLVGLFGALVVLRSVYARINKGASREPPWPEE